MSTAWGDADALAEAGFCYAQGIGCKKDLKKSAKFYRQAEAKGISMIGNSWLVTLRISSPFYYLIQGQDIQIQIQ
jgi:TPR repeat protein